MPVETPEALNRIRLVLEPLMSKWTLPVLNELCRGPTRFNALKRANPGVTQKALTQCLRRLEANGLVSRTVETTSPLAVSYEVTALGASLEPITRGMLQWAEAHLDDITDAQAAYAERTGKQGS